MYVQMVWVSLESRQLLESSPPPIDRVLYIVAHSNSPTDAAVSSWMESSETSRHAWIKVKGTRLCFFMETLLAQPSIHRATEGRHTTLHTTKWLPLASGVPKSCTNHNTKDRINTKSILVNFYRWQKFQECLLRFFFSMIPPRRSFTSNIFSSVLSSRGLGLSCFFKKKFSD